MTLARAPIDPSAKLECVSYAPFRGAQSPLDPSLVVQPDQIAEDLAQLAKITNCVRTYSADAGFERVPAIAQKLGLKVIQGIWIGGDRFKNKFQIDTAIDLTKKFPDTITALVVGNEVLLRADMLSSDLVSTIRMVKSKVTVPVTYADVWEFWLRYRDVAEAVDFVTIHILPYWEDFPISARNAAAHVDSIRKRLAVAFPNKEILIGETGWPSAGRMRDGALPSRTNQARVVSEILELAHQEKFRVNLIEAYDQPWKRRLEGTVGGYWGLIDAGDRELKYPAGVPISDFPMWKLQMGFGLLFCVLVYGLAFVTLRRKPWSPHLSSWLAVSISATVGGALAGLAVEKMLVESLDSGGWIRGILMLATALSAPFLATDALMQGRGLPTFLELIGPVELRNTSKVQRILAGVLIVTTALAVESALGFVFDPRYRDFPFATLTMAVVPFFILMLLGRPASGSRPVAEAVFAAIFAASAVYIVFNEGAPNWQSLWTCAVYILLGFTLWQARVLQTPKPEAQ